jgi:hypothetical protein
MIGIPFHSASGSPEGSKPRIGSGVSVGGRGVFVAVEVGTGVGVSVGRGVDVRVAVGVGAGARAEHDVTNNDIKTSETRILDMGFLLKGLD